MPSSARNQPPKTAATEKPGRPSQAERRLGERRQSAEIRGRERTLESVLQNLPDAVARLDKRGRHLFVNPALETMLGLSSAEIVGKTLAELPLLAEAQKRWMSRVRKVFSSGATLNVEDSFEGPLGRRYQEATLVPERDENGEVTTVLIVIRDVTEQHQAAKSLIESEERFRVVFNKAPIAMILIDQDVHIRGANPAATKLLGYSHKQLVGKTIYEITHPDDVELTRGVAERMLEGNEPTVAVEKRYLRKDGGVVWGRLSVSAVRDSDHGVVFNVEQIVDITQLKQAERALREREELQRVVTEQATDVIAVVDLDFTIRLVSESVHSALGYKPEELVGHGVDELIAPEMIEEVRAGAEKIIAGRPPRSRSFRVRNRSGGWRLFEGIGSVAHDENGASSYLVVVLRDVTEREQLERQLIVARKMEAVGQLAGGVAHDFNNLLTVINGFADLSLKALDGREEAVGQYLNEIGDAGRRAAELTHHLLAFSRQQVLQPEVVDLNAIVAEYAGMLRRMLGEEIELATRLEPDLNPVLVDPGQLGQVLTNLAVNARDAMPGGGTITIGTANAELEEALPLTQGSLVCGSYVVLSVADAGEGIAPEVREHVFEPFFTTKGPGQGTGLGLSTVLGIVEQSGGAITVESEPGAGTIFRIYLPRSSVATPAKPVRAEGVTRGVGTVLVVEDDDAVRKLVAKILLAAGYRVLVSSSAREALALVNWEPSIDVLVTDVVMPEMNGHELGQRLLAQRPELRVLYISGYTPDVVRARGVVAQQEAFLQKPFTAAMLTETVRDLISKKSAS